MADQSATALYDPAKTEPSQLVSAFADAKSSGESRFTLALASSSAGSATQEGSGTSDTSNDFAPPLPPGSPDFGDAGSTASEAAESAGGDFEIRLDDPAE